MFNPPGSSQDSGSYVDLLKRMTQRMQENGVEVQMINLLQQGFERELDSTKVMLSRPERVRLFRQVGQAVLARVLEKIAAGKG